MKAHILLLVYLALSFANFAFGQINYFEYKTYKSGEEFSFPIFSRSADISTAKKINQHLQLSELELLDGYQKDDIFEQVSIDDGRIYGGKVGISFAILSNNSKVLSIAFNEAACGMTCTYWIKYYNFNSGNGDLVQLKDYFTDDGFSEFKKTILEKRTENLKIEILKVDSSDREEDLHDILGCIEMDDLDDYYINDTVVFIDGENCLRKDQKFFGLDMIITFNLFEFKSFLNDFGKAVFGVTRKSVSKYRSSGLPQLFEGSIADTMPILLILRTDYDNQMSGIYTYLKYGRGIDLEGELNNGELTLTESDDDFEENGVIKATFKDNNINGTWTNKDKTKTLKFVVSRR